MHHATSTSPESKGPVARAFGGILYWGGALSLSCALATPLLAAPLAGVTVHAVGANAGRAEKMLDTNPDGSQDLGTLWVNNSASTVWFTLDLQTSTIVNQLSIATKGNRTERVAIAVGDSLIENQVSGTGAVECAIPAGPQSVPDELVDCAVPDQIGRYVTVRSVQRNRFRVHGVEVEGVLEAEPPADLSVRTITDRVVQPGQVLTLTAIVDGADSNTNLSVVSSLPGSAPTLTRTNSARWRFSWMAPGVASEGGPFEVTLTATGTTGATASSSFNVSSAAQTGGIRISPDTPWYWEFNGNTQVFIGGTDQDSLFQWSERDIRNHLDALVEAGGNYIRNAMNSRSMNAAKTLYKFNKFPQPFLKLGSGKYDLNQFNDAYWSKLQFLLQEAKARSIVVQLELWDAYAVTGFAAWPFSPFNPDMNINYTYSNTQLVKNPNRPSQREFFSAVPGLNNDTRVLDYQERFVAKLLSISEPFDNVLYQIDNESWLPPEVGQYWSMFAQARTNKLIYIADSRRYHGPSFRQSQFQDPGHPENFIPIDNPDLFNYADLAQNGGNSGQKQYDNLLWYRDQLAAVAARPINHVKTYRYDWASGARFRDRQTISDQAAAAKAWRTVFGGGASVRYHRQNNLDPLPGLGLGPIAVRNLKSLRIFLDNFDVPASLPDNGELINRSRDEAYLLRDAGEGYAVYFTGKQDRRVRLQLNTRHTLRWLRVANSTLESMAQAIVLNAGERSLVAPGSGQWVAILDED